VTLFVVQALKGTVTAFYVARAENATRAMRLVRAEAIPVAAIDLRADGPEAILWQTVEK